MQFEVEQKFPVADLPRLEAAIAALHAEPGATLRQVDRYFRHPSRDYPKTDEALRIRSVGDDNFVTYKGPKIDTTTKTRRELELPIEPAPAGAERFAELLAALGFTPVATVEKTRRQFHLAWDGHEVEIALDAVVRVGSFVEIELIADEHALDDAKACLQSLAARLQLNEPERRSYLELLLNNIESTS